MTRNMCPSLRSIHTRDNVMGTLEISAVDGLLVLIFPCLRTLLGSITRGVIVHGTSCTYLWLLSRINIDISYS
jgi:hypothetical protein